MLGLSPRQEYKSPHFDSTPIPVEFLVIHYTAQSLKESLNIFLSTQATGKTVSCHLLIDREGQVFELVSCWEGICHRAFHAGKSRWTEPKQPLQKTWKSFNNFSIGVELVNLNGNFYPYTKAQYESLFQVINHLKKVYPKLKDPHRILGHEHISGFRGKTDPGITFHWERLFKEVYGTTPFPERFSRISKTQMKNLAPLLQTPLNDEKAKKLSLILESSSPFWLKKRRLKWLMSR